MSNLPLGFGQIQPHDDTDGYGECAVHEAGLETE